MPRTRLAHHLRLTTDGDLSWRFRTALHFANQDLVDSFNDSLVSVEACS